MGFTWIEKGIESIDEFLIDLGQGCDAEVNVNNTQKTNRRYGKPPYAAVCLLESGGTRGNMLTWRFAFVPPLYRTNGEKL